MKITVRRVATLLASAGVGVGVAIAALPSAVGALPAAPPAAPPRPAWVNPDGTIDMSKAHNIPVDQGAPASTRARFPSGTVDLSTLVQQRGDAPGQPSHP